MRGSILAMISMLLALAAVQAPVATPAAPASPGEIVAAAPKAEWVAIAPEDLLVMTLAPDAGGKPRRVVIQLMPAPFSARWVGNIRALAKARWWDGMSVNRVQDNYVAQWGDPDGEDAGKAKTLPAGLNTMTEAEYVVTIDAIAKAETLVIDASQLAEWQAKLAAEDANGKRALAGTITQTAPRGWHQRDSYAAWTEVHRGWPLGGDGERMWPVHCYGMVGVGRNLSPDTGSGAELYAVIGHAPRHLDRNIAVVGRVVEGIEHLSSLPRGTEALGFYATAAERTSIASIRLASDLPAGERPRFEYLSTEGASFARYVEARANRKDAFFIRPAGGADVCNLPVPVRRVP